MGSIAVLGAGSWGTTIAAVLASHRPVSLWARRAEHAAEMQASGRNPRYCGEMHLPPSLLVSAEMEEVVGSAETVVVAVPSHGFRSVMMELAAHRGSGGMIVTSVTKGIEEHTLMRMSEIVAQLLPHVQVAALTGPNVASEVAAGLPAASVVAATDPDVAEYVRSIFANGAWRVYTNSDLVGCEVAGAVKNVLALAAGMVEGMGLGANARAAVVTRGLAELTRLGVVMGGDPLTFAGLAGIGDVFVSCTSGRTRNHRVGRLLGGGMPLPEILESMDQVAEGVRTARVTLELSSRHGVELPIVEQVARVVAGEITAGQAVDCLLARDSKPEMAGLPSLSWG